MERLWAFIQGLVDKVVAFVTDPRTITTALIIVGILLFIGLLTVVSKWRLYSQAGFPGWACMVPFYGDYVLVRLAGFSGWYFPITLVPSLDPYSFLVVQIFIARAYGRSVLFGLGLYALPFIFYPVLWLSGSKYLFPRHSVLDVFRKLRPSSTPGGRV